MLKLVSKFTLKKNLLCKGSLATKSGHACALGQYLLACGADRKKLICSICSDIYFDMGETPPQYQEIESINDGIGKFVNLKAFKEKLPLLCKKFKELGVTMKVK